MPRKTIIIFITVFILVGAAVLGFYYYKKQAATTTEDATTPGYQDFNPFSSNDSTSTPTNTDTSVDTGGDTPIPSGDETQTIPQASRFHKITEFAVAGATYFEDTRPLPEAQAIEATPAAPTTTKTTKQTKPVAPKFEIVPSLRYVERVTGHIDQMYLDTKTTGKISNSTIPAIYEAIFDGKAQTVIYRYLGDDDNSINTFMATLGGTKGEFLAQNIIDVSLSTDKSKFFYLTKTSSGVVGTTRTFGETKSTQVFNSPFSEWLSQWVGNQKIYLTTKASSSIEGNLFSLNTATGSLAKVFGGVLGLTTLANTDGSLILYSSSIATGPRLGVFNVSKHTTIALNAYSLPEKCLWAKDSITVYCAVPNNISNGQYPDFWYKGQVSFDDHFIRINTTTGDIINIADSLNETAVDGTHLFLNKAEDQLFFINKKDSTLWSLDLK